MKNELDKETAKRIREYVSIQITISIIASFLSILLIQFVANGNVLNWPVIRTSLGIIIPMAVLLGIIGVMLSRHLYKQTIDLANTSILYTKLNSKVIVENKKEYDLDEQIRNCIIIMQSQLNDKNIEIDCDLQKVKYYSNYDMMQEVWINLISNSIKYTNSNGKISIFLKEIDEEIIVTIEDNGIGMSKEQVEHIFERYYQVDKSKHGVGLGIGLSIVYRVLELVDGKIEVESELGKGSKFMVTLKR